MSDNDYADDAEITEFLQSEMVVYEAMQVSTVEATAEAVEGQTASALALAYADYVQNFQNTWLSGMQQELQGYEKEVDAWQAQNAARAAALAAAEKAAADKAAADLAAAGKAAAQKLSGLKANATKAAAGANKPQKPASDPTSGSGTKTET